MFGREELAELELRKRALVIESELNRLALRNDWQHLCTATQWVGHMAQWWRQANPWLTLLAPLAGVMTARTVMRGEGGIVSRALGLLKWVRPLLALWRSVMATPPPESQSKPADS